ncbi:glycosyltransferase family 8 protein [Pseudomonas glycinae]|uniref:glycosyltransferase family 8 protein n=1 Tax=Candidatus Pseudomonas auctus TaxID=3461260 RepID=UPI003B90322D
MIDLQKKSMILDLQKSLDLTQRDYRICDKKTPRENLSDLEVFTIRFALNSTSTDELILFLDGIYGSTDGRSIRTLLSLAVLYGADRFIVNLISHPLFEFVTAYSKELVDLASGLLCKNEIESAKTLIQYLVGVCPYDLKIKALELRLTAECYGEREVDELFLKITPQDFMMESSLAEFRIDFLCEHNRLDEAGKLIAGYSELSCVPSSLLGRIIYYHIEVGNFVIGRALLKYWLRPEFCYHTQMQTVLRVIDSKAGAQEVVGMIEDVEGWYRFPDLLSCREAICSAYGLTSGYDLSDSGFLDFNTFGSPLKNPDAKNVILFCIDRSYRVPALVAIFGLVREMSHCSEKPVLALFLPEVEMPFWIMISRQLSKFEEWPDFLLIHENMPDISKTREHYGCLSLRTLPPMAYGRLFAIKMLSRLGYDKLLYLDADVVITNDLTPIFATNQLGYPVSGAVDRPIDKVVRAMKIHGISNKKYMNSGVMLFDLKHPATEVILKKAIGYVLDPDVELIFHDQCAINRALKGHFHPLPRKYNTFLFPGMLTNRESESVILHFLDCPKPWEVAHRGGHAVSLWHNQMSLAKKDSEKFGLDELECVNKEMMPS